MNEHKKLSVSEKGGRTRDRPCSSRATGSTSSPRCSRSAAGRAPERGPPTPTTPTANVAVREDDRTATSRTGSLSPGRRHTFTYDQADWLTQQIDDHASAGNAGDDRRITTQFFPTGWEKQRVVARSNGSGGWNTKQTTEWTHFANSRLTTLTTKKGSGAVVEQRTVDYVEVGIYVNGHRTSDTFTLAGQNTQCKASACNATYTDDPRDRLMRHADGQSPPTVTEYDLDVVGNVRTETVNGAVARRSEYAADRLLRELNAATRCRSATGTIPTGTSTASRTPRGPRATAPPPTKRPPSPSLLQDFAFDGLDSLISYRKYDGGGNKTDSAIYEPGQPAIYFEHEYPPGCP